MHPPSWVCTAAFRKHPRLRLAWAGRDKIRPGDENPGDFALVQLIDAGVIGPLEDPIVYDEIWHVVPRFNAAGTLEMAHIDRGPIFNKHGGTTHDWDPITQVPIYIINLKQLGFSNQQVCDGEFLDKLDRWMTPWRQRLEDSKRKKLRDSKSEVKDLANEATDFLWSEANKTGSTNPIVPWKYAKKDVQEMYRRKETRGLENFYK